MAFQPENVPFMTGTLSLTITDASGIAPTNIIQQALGCTVNLTWTMSGLNVPVEVAALGDFNPQVFLERQGPGAELAFAGAAVPVAGGAPSGPPPTRTYTAAIPVPPGVAVGLYRLTAVVTRTLPGGIPTGMAAFEDGPILQVVA
jgi:hypothetical protein